MKTYTFQVTTLSDTLLGGGSEVPGTIDNDYETDEYGFPIAGGKRIKGLFVEACSDLLSAIGSPLRVVNTADHLFGQLGDNRERVAHFGSAELPPPVRYRILQAGYRPEEIKEVYGVVRRMTAIDDDLGIQAEKSLRAFRLLRSGITLSGQLVTSGFEMNHDQLQLLAWCAQSINEAGTRRKRGMGEVRIHFPDIQPETAWLQERAA